MNSLLQQVEQKREQLYYVSKKLGLNHPKTVKCSQELDWLINKVIELKVEEYSKNFIHRNKFHFRTAL
jgi:predicted ATP-grasp superfamily ATP-dependent carboligase